MTTSSAKKTKKRPVRKTEKRYEMVHFDLDFVEGEIELPSFKQVPTKVQRLSMKGDPDGLIEFLEKYAAEGVSDLLDDLDEGEVDQFMSSWAAASGVDLGK